MASRDIIRLAAMATAAVLLCLAASTCSAHEAYDPDCCSQKDCAPIPVEHTPRITPLGYVLHDGTFVSKTAPARRDSKDMRWHRCDGAYTLGPVSTMFVRCLYVPSGGS